MYIRRERSRARGYCVWEGQDEPRIKQMMYLLRNHFCYMARCLVIIHKLWTPHAKDWLLIYYIYSSLCPRPGSSDAMSEHYSLVVDPLARKQVREGENSDRKCMLTGSRYSSLTFSSTGASLHGPSKIMKGLQCFCPTRSLTWGISMKGRKRLVLNPRITLRRLKHLVSFECYHNKGEDVSLSQ